MVWKRRWRLMHPVWSSRGQTFHSLVQLTPEVFHLHSCCESGTILALICFFSPLAITTRTGGRKRFSLIPSFMVLFQDHAYCCHLHSEYICDYCTLSQGFKWMCSKHNPIENWEYMFHKCSVLIGVLLGQQRGIGQRTGCSELTRGKKFKIYR